MAIGMQAAAPARVERLMINLDTALPMMCAWDDCDRRARTPYQIRVHEHTGRCNSEAARYGRHTHYVFCSERCRDYWAACSGPNAHETAARNQGRIYGMAPAGSKIGRYR
jgi:hypothetical protein